MRWLGLAARVLLLGFGAGTSACSSPSSESHVAQSAERAVDSGTTATPGAGEGGDGGASGTWGRADAAAGRDSAPRYDAAAPDANGDPTAYTLGSVQCGGGAACGPSNPVCCVGRQDICKSFNDKCASTDVAVSCDGPEDCGLGEVCCATASRVACDPEGASHCPIAPDTSATIACHSNVDCSSAAPVCDREANVVLALLTCHRTCTSDSQCDAAGMRYCYVAAGARSAEPLCHSLPR